MESCRFGKTITPGGYRVDEVTAALQKEIRRGNEWHALQVGDPVGQVSVCCSPSERRRRRRCSICSSVGFIEKVATNRRARTRLRVRMETMAVPDFQTLMRPLLEE